MPRYRKPSGWGYVYIIKSSNGLHKIGLSVNIRRRLKQLQRAYAPEQLRLVRQIETDSMMNTERQLHNILSRRHVHGEWFALTPEDFRWVDLIEQNIQAYLNDLRQEL